MPFRRRRFAAHDAATPFISPLFMMPSDDDALLIIYAAAPLDIACLRFAFSLSERADADERYDYC